MTPTALFRVALLCLPLTLAAQSAYDIALIGDMPYGVANEPRYERVIADINALPSIEFTAHIGDTKSGSTRCDNSHYTRSLTWFNTFERPLLYTVGDNEWTDCLRANNGGFDPLDRLALVRKTYFGTNMSLGRRPIALQRQSDDPKYSKFVENAMLVKAPAVFVTIHITGSNNNLEYKTVQGAANPFYDSDKEYAERNAANIAWLRKAFQTARDTKSLGLMILTQANMFETFLDTSVGSTHSGFTDFIAVLREETGKFAGEVVMVSGDSHYMRVDKPLTDKYPSCLTPTGTCVPYDAAPDGRGVRVLNFTRVEVPGSSDVHWVLCHVRPNNRNVFQFEFMIVPETGTGATGVRTSVTGSGTAVAANTFETVGNQINLDASGSTSSNAGDLTYSWAASPGYPPAAIIGVNSATPVIQLNTRGTYQFILTVTDRTGAAASTNVTVRYS
ncbi:MAG: hypothetical protein H7Y20_13075 [Bryobacteraceae bacterium]|nr:hypothetical protein [Bryobacteraceae bacterium]